MNMRSADLQKHMDATWTTQYLCKGFRVSAMAINIWRKNRGLPAVVIGGGARPAIRFVPKDVLAWAKENGVTWYLV